MTEKWVRRENSKLRVYQKDRDLSHGMGDYGRRAQAQSNRALVSR